MRVWTLEKKLLVITLNSDAFNNAFERVCQSVTQEKWNKLRSLIDEAMSWFATENMEPEDNSEVSFKRLEQIRGIFVTLP